MVPIMDSLLTVEEVAKTLRLSPDDITEFVRTGDLDAIVLGSNPHAPIRIPASELGRFARRGIVRNGLAVAAAHD